MASKKEVALPRQCPPPFKVDFSFSTLRLSVHISDFFWGGVVRVHLVSFTKSWVVYVKIHQLKLFNFSNQFFLNARQVFFAFFLGFTGIFHKNVEKDLSVYDFDEIDIRLLTN